nr:hypothetical protein [uncultured Pseudomonas sp.]
MIIKLSPIRCEKPVPAVSVQAEIVVIDGERFDFSPLPEGASLPAEAVGSTWFVGQVERIAGELIVTLRLPHGASPSSAVAFPEPLTVTVDGPVMLPFDPPEDDVLASTEEVIDEH